MTNDEWTISHCEETIASQRRSSNPTWPLSMVLSWEFGVVNWSQWSCGAKFRSLSGKKKARESRWAGRQSRSSSGAGRWTGGRLTSTARYVYWFWFIFHPWPSSNVRTCPMCTSEAIGIPVSRSFELTYWLPTRTNATGYVCCQSCSSSLRVT